MSRKFVLGLLGTLILAANSASADGVIKDIKVEERKYDNYMYYGPVPQTEILKWDQLKQNAGWKITND